MNTDALRTYRIDLARTMEQQAKAIADGTVIGPEWSAAKRLLGNAEQLFGMTPDDRT